MGGRTTAAEPIPHADLGVSVAPNPAASLTRVSFSLPEAHAVRVSAFDLLGREVVVLHDGPTPAGPHAVSLDATALPAGVYVVRVMAGRYVQTAQVTVAR